MISTKVNKKILIVYEKYFYHFQKINLLIMLVCGDRSRLDQELSNDTPKIRVTCSKPKKVTLMIDEN